MLRFVNLCLLLGLVGLAYVIYEVKYEARALDQRIATLRKQIEVERDALAVLRAEWSLLNRPERIERLAARHLQLKAASPQQIVTFDALGTRAYALDHGQAVDETPTAAIPTPPDGQ